MPDGQMTLAAGTYERQAYDLYPTEPWVTRALLDREKFEGTVWEPACGRGDMVNVLRQYGYQVIASDIQGDGPGCEGAVKADFLTCAPLIGGVRLTVITNPPYGSIQSTFIRRALSHIQACGGAVAMLLRNEADSSMKRRAMFGECPMYAKKLVLTARPWWAESRDNHPRHNYSWFIWRSDHKGPALLEYAYIPAGQRSTKTYADGDIRRPRAKTR